MRLKEWFGWHFPELIRSITDIFLLVKVIILIRCRDNVRDDFENFKGPLIELIGSEEIVAKIKADADISMGVTLSVRYLMGTAQNILSIASFLAPLSTLRIVFERQSAESVPFLLTMMNLFSSVSWCLYGVLKQDTFVYFPNGLGVLVSALTMSLFLVYPPSRFVIFK